MLRRLRTAARSLLVAVIRRTPAPKVTTREVYDRLVCELDTGLLALRTEIAVQRIARELDLFGANERVEETAGDAWRAVGT